MMNYQNAALFITNLKSLANRKWQINLQSKIHHIFSAELNFVDRGLCR